MKIKILIGLNSAWNIYNFRLGLIEELQLAGYEVYVCAPVDEYSKKLIERGIKFRPLEMDGRATGFVSELLVIYRYFQLIRSLSPQVFLGFTIKPNIYGSLVCRVLGVAAINNIAGLGIVFQKGGLLRQLAIILYRVALRPSKLVFFQNRESLEYFVARKIVKPENSALLPGSGVDLRNFQARPFIEGPRRFVMIARLLWTKGVKEFVDACNSLKADGFSSEYLLVGFIDVENPDALSKPQVEELTANGVVKFLGASDDVAAVIQRSHCVVLPSYYPEGTPKILLEAAASARPIITTNTPGCRDVVKHGRNGYLCRPRDSGDLAKAMSTILRLTDEELQEMGRESRRIAEQKYDEKLVRVSYCDAIGRLSVP